MLDYFRAWRFQRSLNNHFIFPRWQCVAQSRAEKLMAGVVLEVEENTPDKIGRKSAKHDNDISRQSRPKFGRAGGN